MACIEKGIEYHRGNRLLPVHSCKKTVLSPAEVVALLLNINTKDSSVPVCAQKPTKVTGNVSFIIDLRSLTSKDDVKYDESGSWRNNSCTKFKFARVEDEWVQQTRKKDLHKETISLKREYFALNGKYNLRRRIDTITSKYCIID